MTHMYLKNRLTTLWNVSEDILLIDLGYEYYTIKFLKEENMKKAFYKGLWFINGLFLSIKHW